VGEILTSIEEAAAIVDRGGLVVAPTETVFGLMTRPEADLVARLIAVKERPQDKSIQLLVPDASWIGRVSEQTADAEALAAAFWPGPLTLVLAASAGAPAALVSEGTIGVRVPAHPIALDLLARCGPLAASSANRSGEPTPADIATIRDLFGNLVDGYLDGGDASLGAGLDAGMTVASTGSTVVDLSSGRMRLLRDGPIARADMEALTDGRFASG
jgi:L-threonylcarbamoyladenylate synthase